MTETAAIFDELANINREAPEDPTMLRLSLDAKARVNIVLFDRGGKNRITVETNDHNFNPKTTLTPETFNLVIKLYI